MVKNANIYRTAEETWLVRITDTARKNIQSQEFDSLDDASGFAMELADNVSVSSGQDSVPPIFLKGGYWIDPRFKKAKIFSHYQKKK